MLSPSFMDSILSYGGFPLRAVRPTIWHLVRHFQAPLLGAAKAVHLQPWLAVPHRQMNAVNANSPAPALRPVRPCSSNSMIATARLRLLDQLGVQCDRGVE